MIDLVKPVVLVIKVEDKKVWVDNENECLLRAYGVGTVVVEDRREHQWLIETWHGLTKLMDVYRPESMQWAGLCESRRLVEVECKRLGIKLED